MTPEISVRRATPPDEKTWLHLLRQIDTATLYQTSAWCDFVRDVFGHGPEHLVAERNGVVTGVLPLFRVKLPWSRDRLLSLPYDVTSGGPFAADDESAIALANEAMRIARADRLHSLELRLLRPLATLDATELTRSDLVVVSTIPLDSREAAWKRVSADQRQSIRKAMKSGTVVRPASSLEDYLAYYRVYLQVFRGFGTPPYSRRYFVELYRRFHASGEARLQLALVGDQIVGGCLAFAFGRGVVSKSAIVLEHAVDARVYPALYGACIDMSLDLGAEWLSWGSSSRSQKGLIEFKQRWGGVAETSVRYALPVSGVPADMERYYDSDALARRVWRRLPLKVTATLGGPLNRWFC